MRIPLRGRLYLSCRAALLVLLAVVAPAEVMMAQSPVPAVHDGAVHRGTLSFDGRSTLGDFVGSTDSVTGAVVGAAAIGAVRGHVEAPAATLRTGNDHRDRDLNKSLESARYPEIRFDLDSATVTSGAPASATESGDSIPVTLHGTLHIHGVDRAVELPAAVLRAPGTLRVRSDFPLDLKDYHIGGLSRFLGMFKMQPDIVVHVDVTFEQP